MGMRGRLSETELSLAFDDR